MTDSARKAEKDGKLAQAWPLFGRQVVLVNVGRWSSSDFDRGSSDAIGLDNLEEPSEAMFKRLAISAPERLLSIIASGQLDAPSLCFAAESAGYIKDAEKAVPVLEKLLMNPASIVREGAVCGLGRHPSPYVERVLRRVLDEDPSAGVRDAAEDFLDSM